jgi:hypothetical protein
VLDGIGLFHTPEHEFNYPATGSRRIAPLHFIAGDRDRSCLLSTIPIRKRTGLDFKREGLVRYRVGAVSGDTSLYDCCVLLWSSRSAVVGCEFGKFLARE